MEPCVDDCFNILCSPALGLEGNDHFRQPFYKCHNGTFMMDADNGIAFQMSKFFFECWVVRLSVREFPSESLSPKAFLMAVGFSLSFHRQGGNIKVFALEHAVQCAAGAVDRLFTATDNHIRRPSLRDFFCHICALIIRQHRLFSTATLLVCLVALIEIQCGVTVFQESDHIVDGLTCSANLFLNL